MQSFQQALLSMAPELHDDRASVSASTASDASKLPVRSSKRIQLKAFEQIKCFNSEAAVQSPTVLVSSSKRGGDGRLGNDSKKLKCVTSDSNPTSPRASGDEDDDATLVGNSEDTVNQSHPRKKRRTSVASSKFRLHRQQHRGPFKRNTIAVGAFNIRRRNRQLYDIAKAPRGSWSSAPRTHENYCKFYHDWECGGELCRTTEIRICDSIAHASRYSGALEKWIQIFGGGSVQAFAKSTDMHSSSGVPWWQQRMLPPISADDIFNSQRITTNGNEIAIPSVDTETTNFQAISNDAIKPVPSLLDSLSSRFFLQPVFVESFTTFGYPPRCSVINHDVLFPDAVVMPRSTATAAEGHANFKCFLCASQHPCSLSIPYQHDFSSSKQHNSDTAESYPGFGSSTRERFVANDFGFLHFLLHIISQHGSLAQSLEFDLDLPHGKLYFRCNTSPTPPDTSFHISSNNVVQQMSTGHIRRTLENVKVPPRTYIHSVSGRPINPIMEASLLLGNTTRVGHFDATDSDEEPLPEWQERMSMWQTNDYIDISPDEKWLLQSWKLFALSCGLCQRSPTISMYEAVRQFIAIHLRDISFAQQQQTKGVKSSSMVKWLSVPLLLGAFHLHGAINADELKRLRKLIATVRTEILDKTKENDEGIATEKRYRSSYAVKTTPNSLKTAMNSPASQSKFSSPKSNRSLPRLPSSIRKINSNESSQKSDNSSTALSLNDSQAESDASSGGVFLTARSNRGLRHWRVPSSSTLSTQSSPLHRSTTATAVSTPTRSVVAAAKPAAKIGNSPRTRSRSRK